MNNTYQRNLMRLRGFCDGAGARPMKPIHEANADYQKGYTDGQRAKRDYAETSARELGVMIREIKAARYVGPPENWSMK